MFEGKDGENSVEDIISRYKDDVASLAPYITWLKEHTKQQVAESYSNSELSKSMPFPVYDSNLLSFVKQAQQTKMMNRNYTYVYTRNHLHTYKDELLFIEDAEITDMDDLAGILSRYILEGQTKGTVWAEGVYTGVLYAVVYKMDDLIHFWGTMSY
ncbi:MULTISPECIES: hypothetical protein [unclassified Butyrivibrio]|uniref:hypothetical protein n=1 Tax=unclassified Butyrivibrio TaxID=2639466 RepID=UPI00041EB2BA|nr:MULTISPECIES: hypothetical protein [unclassified Butyrivibrio]SDB02194.1 hypothetical protein SAMN02910263_00024 [Butyrivibrio sp. INlla16]SEL48923.1 hypothetical protein SAMN04487770_11130 [Butyrivibrio sp. ob235]